VVVVLVLVDVVLVAVVLVAVVLDDGLLVVGVLVDVVLVAGAEVGAAVDAVAPVLVDPAVWAGDVVAAERDVPLSSHDESTTSAAANAPRRNRVRRVVMRPILAGVVGIRPPLAEVRNLGFTSHTGRERAASGM
jgi:hypothetical protein